MMNIHEIDNEFIKKGNYFQFHLKEYRNFHGCLCRIEGFVSKIIVLEHYVILKLTDEEKTCYSNFEICVNKPYSDQSLSDGTCPEFEFAKNLNSGHVRLLFMEDFVFNRELKISTIKQ